MKKYYQSLSKGSLIPEIPIITNETTSYFMNNTRWVMAIRDNIYLAVSDNLLEVSLDYGVTYPNTIAFANANRLVHAYIFSNGNILMFTKAKDATDIQRLYLTNSNLLSVAEKFVYLSDGITPHTQVANENYYVPLVSQKSIDTDILAWGCYALNNSDMNLFATTDFGETTKIIFDFSANNLNLKHVHTVDYNKNNNKWYCVTGDHVGVTSEIKWLEGVYNNDVWTWTNIPFHNGDGIPIQVPRGHVKAIGMFFRRISGVDYVYWGADDDSVTSEELGLWRCKISDFTDISKHEHLIEFTNLETFYDLHVNQLTGIVIGIVHDKQTYFSTKKLFMATDFGHGDWEIHEFTNEPTVLQLSMLQPPVDSKQGFYKIDRRWTNATLHGGTFFIKPGLDLFSNL